MKYIVIGLGRFGTALSEQFTMLGHEVIAVDKDMQRIEDIKDKVESAICLDSCDKQALRSLPLADSDGVFVVMGHNFGNSVYTLALLKHLGVKHIVGRALSAVHKDILQAIGVDEVIMPEVDYALQYTNRRDLPQALGGYPFSDQHRVFELPVPPSLVGKPVSAAVLEQEYNVRLLGHKRKTKSKLQQLLSSHIEVITDCDAHKDLYYEEHDQLLLFGLLSDLRRLYL